MGTPGGGGHHNGPHCHRGGHLCEGVRTPTLSHCAPLNPPHPRHPMPDHGHLSAPTRVPTCHHPNPSPPHWSQWGGATTPPPPGHSRDHRGCRTAPGRGGDTAEMSQQEGTLRDKDSARGVPPGLGRGSGVRDPPPALTWGGEGGVELSAGQELQRGLTAGPPLCGETPVPLVKGLRHRRRGGALRHVHPPFPKTSKPPKSKPVPPPKVQGDGRATGRGPPSIPRSQGNGCGPPHAGQGGVG